MCDCGYRIHPGNDCGGSGCRCHDEQNFITVPVTFEGFVVGTADISPAGEIITSELNLSEVGKEIREVLSSGLADSISIRPNFISVEEKGIRNG